MQSLVLVNHKGSRYSSSLPVWVNTCCCLVTAWGKTYSQPLTDHPSQVCPDPSLHWNSVPLCLTWVQVNRGDHLSPEMQSQLCSHTIKTVSQPKCALCFSPCSSPPFCKPTGNFRRHGPLSSEQAEQGSGPGYCCWLTATGCLVPMGPPGKSVNPH